MIRRSTIVRIARGIDVSGCSASPAVIATHFDAHVAGDDERQRQPDAAPSVRQEPAGAVEQVRNADRRRRPDAEIKREPDGDERHDGDAP